MHGLKRANDGNQRPALAGPLHCMLAANWPCGPTWRTRRCRGAPSRPGPAAPGLSTARTSCRRGGRAAVSPAKVRSRISSRSNSASAAKMPNTRRPAAVVVSICAPYPVSTRRPTPRVDRFCTVLTRWAMVRPRRSSFQTTSTSPVRSARTQLSSPGRSSRTPDATSW